MTEGYKRRAVGGGGEGGNISSIRVYQSSRANRVPFQQFHNFYSPQTERELNNYVQYSVQSLLNGAKKRAIYVLLKRE